MNAQQAAPRCYILDENYRLVLACFSSPSDPLNRLYAANSRPDALPAPIDDAVRAITRHWCYEGCPAEASTVVSGVRITAAPLQGAAGRHIAVFVESEVFPGVGASERGAVARDRSSFLHYEFPR